MNIIKENSDNLNAVIKLTIEKSDYAEPVDIALKDYRKKAQVPGFRPGKVPVGLIRKMYGKAILLDEVNKLLSENLSKYIVDEKLDMLGEPLPSKTEQQPIDWDKDETFEFAFDVGLAPEIDISLDKRNKFDYYNITPDDAMIEKQMESYTTRYGENKPVEIVEEKDLVKGDLTQLDEAGNELEEGIRTEQTMIATDLIKDEAIKKEFIGKNSDDTIIFNPLKAFENAHEVSHMLRIEKEAAEKLESDFKMEVTEILRFEKAGINEVLFKKIYGDETEVKTIDDFKKRIQQELEQSLKSSGEYKFALDVKNSLLEKVSFELPEAFLKRWVLATNDKISEEQVENEFGDFINDLRWQLIKNKLAKENELAVSEEELLETAKRSVHMQYLQYGIMDVKEEHLMSHVNQLLEDQKNVESFSNRVMEEKIFELVKTKVTINPKEITSEAFDKLMEKK